MTSPPGTSKRSTEDPDTEVVTYDYDSGGQVRAVTGVKLGQRYPYVARLEYDALG